MKLPDKTALSVIFIFSGFLLFFLHYPFWSPLLFVPFIAFLVSIFSKKRREKGAPWTFLVYGAGLLIIPMKLFYWDSIDMKSRVGNLLVLALVFFIFSRSRRNRIPERVTGFFNRRNLRQRAVLLFTVSIIIFTAASGILVLKGVELVGDEPHYLAISHSIARDGDLNVFNQYARDEYREFINYRLTHHSKVGKGFKKWYSFHLPGLSFTLAPFFLFKIKIPLLYFLVRAYLGIFAALLGVLVYLLALRIWKKEKLSLFVYAVFMCTSPVFFYSFHMFAELQALLLILASVWFALFRDGHRRKDIPVAGLLLGATVFWGMKYLIFILVLSSLFLAKKIREKDISGGIIFTVFPLIFVLLFFLYLYVAYGNLSPMSVYTGVLTDAQRAEYAEGMQSIRLQNRLETLFDYFFDQRDGLLLYNPFYFFFFPGLIIALRKFKKYYPYLLISAASFIYLLYHGYSTVRPGYCPQARYLLPVVWTLMLFSVVYYLENRNSLFKKAFVLLPIYSVFITLYQLFNPFTLYQSTTHNYLDRSGFMFQKLSNININLPSILPSFIKVDGNFKYVPNLVFLALFIALVVFSLRRFETEKKFYPAIPLFLSLFVLFSLFPRVSLYNPHKMKTPGGHPVLVHGNRYPKSDVVPEFVIEAKSSATRTVTFSTVRPLKKIGLQFWGHSNEGTIGVINFARPFEEIGVRRGIEKKVSLDNLYYRKRGGRLYYTLNLDLCYCLERGINIRFIPE